MIQGVRNIFEIEERLILKKNIKLTNKIILRFNY